MNKTFRVVGLNYLDATNEVQVTLRELGTANVVIFVLTIAQAGTLVIGATVQGVFSVV